MIGIGIDTGGTYTDIVVYDMENGKVLGSGKTSTTKDHLEVCILKALDSMDQSYIHQAELLALSTTLATNACLENKGGRAKCLMIGMNPESMSNLDQVYGSYGFRDLKELVFIDGKPEHLFEKPEDPDWEELKEKGPEWFRGCRAVGITQIYPDANGGRFEQEAEKILKKEGFQVTTAWNMFHDVDVLRRGAGTLLNARLIPIITDFLDAVRKALAERNLKMPIAIVAGNGNQMAEAVACERPVETLLSGPAASAVGGSVISGEPDGILVDMGGTTTDIALIREGEPVLADQGISIGQWRTTVKGLYVDTTLLGGDSEVLFENGRILLGKERVIPLSALVQMFPAQKEQIIHRLQALAESGKKHTRMLHEFLVLQNNILADPDLRDRYTPEEIRICEALRNGPLILEDFAEAAGESVYKPGTERLEAEGVIMRSGLTPTDMMVLKGDIDLYGEDSARAVREAVRFLIQNTDPEYYRMSGHGKTAYPVRDHGADAGDEKKSAETGKLVETGPEEAADVRKTAETGKSAETRPEEAVADEVYRLVEKKMYRRIVEILMAQQHPGQRRYLEQDGVKRLIDWSFEEARKGDAEDWAGMRIHTDLPIIGVGAPVHIFLPAVAEYLGTRAVIHPFAGVANALGAIAGKVSARVSIHVKADYQGAVPDGFSVTDGKGKHKFEHYEDAEKYAEKTARKLAAEDARRQGAGENPEIRILKRQIRTSSAVGPEVFFETVVEAVASGRFRVSGRS
ncbi:hydantoinase/oxoprolinase family protein [Bilifractor sp. LCP21S3_A7]|uniref:hydantoinase/oxoprolinase family protein n=1 Tax=Bilifractor sp. LCP21S3_A7 TaxID=3438738 RepID=UPI003F9249CA